jgi:hypothetical protein
MVMSRWLVRMMPRCRQLDKARVTVARDAPVKLASSSWVRVIAALTSLSRQSASSSRRPASRCAQLLVRHDQRAHRADGLHGGGPVSGGLPGHLPDGVPAAAQRQRQLVPVAGHPHDLDPAVHQHEHVGSRIALDAHHRAGRVDRRSAEAGEGGPLVVAEQSPEALGRSRPMEVHITVTVQQPAGGLEPTLVLR